ncbi:hypothetical protein GH714_002242 [Hevea brasiliensis]|uniref:HAT C-terminal dimerisation domain-containing protein n=1 Tax=Hevea brasiliensis TaxID=3981 RepID=A0A6A6LJ59_HEVBR|nr:hypothetical protein GH714_002242 [Hevea brasiliensis]
MLAIINAIVAVGIRTSKGAVMLAIVNVIVAVLNILPVNGMPIQTLTNIKLCAEAVQAECLNIYEEEKTITKRFLRNLAGQISLSVVALRCPVAVYTWKNKYTNLKGALEFEANGEWSKDVYDGYEKLTADEWKKVEDSFISSIAEKMLEKLDNYLKNMFMVLAMATESMTDSTSFNSGQDSSKQASYGCSDLLQEYQQFVEANNYPAKSDLDLYLEDGVLTWSQDFDTLCWWRAASPKYPVLSSIACDFLAISVSVVTGLEAYYTIEREIGPRLASLKPDLMKALTLPAE